ncbi:MAG: TetR/AcrR family transcriptional regulator [Pseudomonadota bacterium]|nr:TetR/AcrR family transcriptional regulator [Pseudomonadota bacterium]
MRSRLSVESAPAAPDTPQKARIRQISAQLFAEKGYNAVGIAAIGDAVGLARGALYYHIGSKEDLLYDIVIRYMVDLVESGQLFLAEEKDPVSRLRLLSRHLMRVIAEHLSEMTVCFREVNSLTGERHRVVSDLHAQYQQIWADTIAEGARRGQFRTVPGVALKGILGMYFYSFLWLDPQGRHGPDEIADIFTDLVARALKHDAPPRRKRLAKTKGADHEQ